MSLFNKLKLLSHKKYINVLTSTETESLILKVSIPKQELIENNFKTLDDKISKLQKQFNKFISNNKTN